MTVEHLTIVLDEKEAAALHRAARTDLRKPQAQARYLLRLALGLAEQSQEMHNRGAADMPLAEIRTLLWVLEAWHEYNTGGDPPSHTELRDMQIVRAWLDRVTATEQGGNA